MSDCAGSLEAAKRALRRRAGDRRRAAFAAAADSIGERVCEHLLGESAFTRAARVALYAALADEVPTRPLFDALARAGTPRLLPRLGPDGRLVFAPVDRWEELRAGIHGILAPPESAPAADLGPDDVVVVPGVAFDRRGRRLGRGGGWYDRTFPESEGPHPLLVGVAGEVQIVESVPHGSHDRAMDAIVTERGFQWTRGER